MALNDNQKIKYIEARLKAIEQYLAAVTPGLDVDIMASIEETGEAALIAESKIFFSSSFERGGVVNLFHSLRLL